MWITPKPFGAPALFGFWACGKAGDAPGIFWGKRHFGAPARGFWRRGGRAGRQPPGGNAEPRPQKGDFGRPKSGYPHYPQKRFPPKVEKKAQQLPGFWRRAHKLSTRLSTDRSAPPGASAQPQNRPKRGEKVYPATLYHTLPAHANKRMGGGRDGDGEGTVLSWSPRKYQRRLRCDVKVKLIKLEGGTAAPRGREKLESLGLE